MGRNRGALCIAAASMCLYMTSGVFSNTGGSGVSSDEALASLKNGNARFLSGHRLYPNQDAARLKQTSGGQKPFVTVLTCSDSRLPAEHIFDAGIGDLFVVRVAGNVAATDEIGTIEYGTEHLGTPLLVVLGHTACGAVTAVVKGDHVGGSIPRLVEPIVPAAALARKKFGSGFSQELLDETIRQNVWLTIENILGKSPIVAGLVAEKKLVVVGALYHLDTGTVEWLGEHPDRKALSGAAGAMRDGGASAGFALWLAVFSTAIVALYLAVYLLFFRASAGRKTGVVARLTAGTVALALAVFITSMAYPLMPLFNAQGGSYVEAGALPLLAGALSLLFAITVARSLAGSFHRVVDSLKAMIPADKSS